MLILFSHETISLIIINFLIMRKEKKMYGPVCAFHQENRMFEFSYQELIGNKSLHLFSVR